MAPVLPITLAALGGGEILVIVLVIVILFFGATKIPELARSLGRAKGEFEKGAREAREELASAEKEHRPTDDEKIIKAAKEMGIPTEGRPIGDIKADVRAKLS
jgi:sec-independent protein translocase protein TatA